MKIIKYCFVIFYMLRICIVLYSGVVNKYGNLFAEADTTRSQSCVETLDQLFLYSSKTMWMAS